jgi:SAM-dependent methyltransferase
MRALEIIDLLWQADEAGHRMPVVQSEAVSMLADLGQQRAAQIVARMPSATGGVLDPGYVDDLMVRVHCELQRLSEELQLPRRIAGLLGPIVARVREANPGGLVRIVDVGCGLGYVLRYLAATATRGKPALGPGIELVGADLNGTLVSAATELAEREGLTCQFVQADAFLPGTVIEDGPRTVVISSGLMHHLGVAELDGFFAAQGRLGVAAFTHWDIVPCFLSTLGAWVLLQARMREPVSRYDGMMSVRRAHPASVLLAAARAGAPGYAPRVLEGTRWHPKAIDVLRPIVGMSAAIQSEGFSLPSTSAGVTVGPGVPTSASLNPVMPLR